MLIWGVSLHRGLPLDWLHEVGADLALGHVISDAGYNKAAADLAWGRTIAFFNETLRAPRAA
jgi:dienelactone hydrolase